MDDLLREFLTETIETLDTVDVELVRFEQEPNNVKILANIFRLVHTIKGTCGFLGLSRLEALAHAAETLMGRFRDGVAVTPHGVTLILSTIDRIKGLLGDLERDEREPAGGDHDLIDLLDQMAQDDEIHIAPAAHVAAGADAHAHAARPQMPVAAAGDDGLDELERAFRETAVDADVYAAAKPPAAPAGNVHRLKSENAGPQRGAAVPAAIIQDEERQESKLAKQSIRVNVETLEQLMTMVSELVLTRNQLLEIVRRLDDSSLKAPLQRLSSVTAELQEGVMKTRMQPIGNAWAKLPRVVRDLATELDKDIELDMHGSDTEIDRQVLDLIKDPLTHMVRNSADHGLETSAERRALGKPEKGTIRLSAYHEGGIIVIEIQDDGRGLNTDAIRNKAVAKGLASLAEIEKMSEAQVHQFIFAAGFSTAQQVTSVSGRGVGMDVVRTNIDAVGGTIDVRSTPRQGTRFLIKIPVTLAIVSALIVESGANKFAIPQVAVVELVRTGRNSEHKIERIKGTPVLRLRNQLLPLINLKTALQMEQGADRDAQDGFIVVAQTGSQTFGIVVDGVINTEEIVIKPLSSRLRHITAFSGTTILGDGSVIMVIDPHDIARGLGTVATEISGNTQHDAAAASGSQSDVTSMLIFRAGGNQPKAVPLALVTRLEEIDAAKIEVSDGRCMVQYRGHLMPLVAVSEQAGLRREGMQPLLVLSVEGRAIGLMVEQIVDIVEEPLNIEVASGSPGLVGSAIIRGEATEVIDVGHFLTIAFEDWSQGHVAGRPARKPSLLIVDDSPFFRNMLTPVLQAAGYHVTAVGSAEAALERLHGDRAIAVVVADTEMPGMNGYDLLAAMRDDPRMSALPMIGVSPVASPETIAFGQESGFHEVVAKFDRHGLVAALRRQVAAARPAA